jgi:uncharacterized protein YoxC
MDSTLIGLIFVLGFPLLAIFLSVKWLSSKKALKATSQDFNKLKRDLENLRVAHQHLQKKSEPLWQYQNVADAQAEVDSMIAKAKAKSDSLLEQGRKWVEGAQLKAQETQRNATKAADAIRSQAQEKANAAKLKAEEILNNAHINADKTITQAQERAHEIAGDALVAKENADIYAKKIKAMKNIINGYGDEYLIATRTLLDDLADNFSHKDGGVKLKEARLFTKTLVKKERYADCDYVENNRRETAIRFVLDAFNGKVDTALSKIKHDNYGKLEQEIKDAFGLVNGLGKPFRNARVTDEYLNARLDELKWGVVSRELQLQEREEQRLIKEAIREEEKARREYEKAVREAEKEERMLKKAMDEARSHLVDANEEQRKMYEEQIAELQAKYDEAEAKNQRALSMAQQTRRGHVYVISNVGSFGEQVYKIGLTRRLEPMDRVKELGDASVPFSFDVHAMIYVEDAPALENELHRHFEDNRLNKINLRKEFFQVQLTDIREVIEAKGVEVHWTMLSEAQEYRESLTIKQREETKQILPVQAEEVFAEAVV